MELTKKQLEELKKQVYNGGKLEEILPREHPEADITLVIGTDNFEEGRPEYTESAFFRKEDAENYARSKNPKTTGFGNCLDTYTTRTILASTLNEKAIVIYTKLKKLL